MVGCWRCMHGHDAVVLIRRRWWDCRVTSCFWYICFPVIVCSFVFSLLLCRNQFPATLILRTVPAESSLDNFEGLTYVPNNILPNSTTRTSFRSLDYMSLASSRTCGFGHGIPRWLQLKRIHWSDPTSVCSSSTILSP